MALIDNILSIYSSYRMRQIEFFKKHPFEVQEKTLKHLVEHAKLTEYGKTFGFKYIKASSEYMQKVPICRYEVISDYIKRSMQGEKNILWPGNVNWYAKSSGTTDARSKFIPVTSTELKKCHFQGGMDSIAIYKHLYPKTKVFQGKTLALGGSSEVSSNNANCHFGDLSAILISHTPSWANRMKVPSSEIMLMSNWDDKIEEIIKSCIHQDVRCMAGVPSWFLTLINKLLEHTGKSSLNEIWPNLELFIHGGIAFSPYKEIYKKLIPSDNMHYLETYNASEGFFGIQDDPSDSSMLLMLDYGVFYEFMPISEIGKTSPKTLPISDVKTGENYAMIITTNGGLWRYMIGDTIAFTSTQPYKFKITGRTKLFINAFGEEVIIDNALDALSSACKQTGAEIYEFTAAPIFMGDGKKGAHEWIVEFVIPPSDPEAFANILDKTLREINSDYDAKRLLSLERLILHVAQPGLFNAWLASEGKMGGQHKVPRLWNDRTHIDKLLKLNRRMSLNS